MYYTKQEEIDARNKKLIRFGAIVIFGIFLFAGINSFVNPEEEINLEGLETSISSELNQTKNYIETVNGTKKTISCDY